MNRELDVMVAKAKGIDVVGELYARFNNDDWFLYFKDDKFPLHPVYIRQCMCDIAYPNETKYKGHTTACLDVVPFWSSDLNKSFELVDEIVASEWSFDLAHNFGWCVELDNMCETFCFRDESPQKAICMAYISWCDLTRN